MKAFSSFSGWHFAKNINCDEDTSKNNKVKKKQRHTTDEKSDMYFNYFINQYFEL